MPKLIRKDKKKVVDPFGCFLIFYRILNFMAVIRLSVNQTKPTHHLASTPLKNIFPLLYGMWLLTQNSGHWTITWPYPEYEGSLTGRGNYNEVFRQPVHLVEVIGLKACINRSAGLISSARYSHTWEHLSPFHPIMELQLNRIALRIDSFVQIVF